MVGLSQRFKKHFPRRWLTTWLIIKAVVVSSKMVDHLAEEVIGALLYLLSFLLFLHFLEEKFKN